MITITRGPEGKSAPGPVMAVGGRVCVASMSATKR